MFCVFIKNCTRFFFTALLHGSNHSVTYFESKNLIEAGGVTIFLHSSLNFINLPHVIFLGKMHFWEHELGWGGQKKKYFFYTIDVKQTKKKIIIVKNMSTMVFKFHQYNQVHTFSTIKRRNHTPQNFVQVLTLVSIKTCNL